MPLPSDQQLITLSEEILNQAGAIFGAHPGFRPLHARGVMATGTFTPTPEAAKLSSAPHFNRASTPITVRFSSSTGLPDIPDTNPGANPRAISVRFNLAEHVHTDLIGHSTPTFPARTGQEFLDFFRAVAGGTVPDFLATHPAARAFVEFPKPFPTSVAREEYFMLHAFKFTNADGISRFGRYTLVPEEGTEYLEEAAVKAKGDGYLYDEIPQRLAQRPFSFNLVIQLANEGDVTDDTTANWPKDRPTVNVGKIKVEALVPDSLREQKKIIFDPVPRVDGIEEAGDPLFDVRAAVYLISGRRRRAAPDS